MCLNTSTWIRKSKKAYENSFKKKEIGVGYKLFIKREHEDYLRFTQPMARFTKIPMSEWITDINKFSLPLTNLTKVVYETGYHLVPTLSQAQQFLSDHQYCWGESDFVIVKVEYANVVAKGLVKYYGARKGGYDFLVNTVIAKKMKVIKVM